MHLFPELLRCFSTGQDGFLFMWGLAAIALMALFLVTDRWVDLHRKTRVDGPLFTERILSLIGSGKRDDAYQLCVTGGNMALPRIFGRAIREAGTAPQLARYAMEEEFVRNVASIDRRVNLLLSLGHIATLLGLMGTIYGLILSFSAAGMKGVAAMDKSVLLASGISTAMNTTLLGLIISIPCVVAYSMLRARIDEDVNEMDRLARPLLRSLLWDDRDLKGYTLSRIRTSEEKETGPNLGPLMSLIIILIPLLLTSAEFVKVGEIELNLPAPAAEENMAETETRRETSNVKLDLSVEVANDGFHLSHTLSGERETSYIPPVGGSYDFAALKVQLAEIKKRVLFQMIREVYADLPSDSTLPQLSAIYSKKKGYFATTGPFPDGNSIQISADDSVEYQHFVAVMDAARDARTDYGRVLLFPDVVVAGGVNE